MLRTRAGYDAILLGYALCGRGTEGLRAGKTQLVLPRAHDCIGLLMGSRQRYQAYFDTHPGVYFRSPGWVENQSSGSDSPAGLFLCKKPNRGTAQPRGTHRPIWRGERQLSLRAVQRVSPPLLRADLYLDRRSNPTRISAARPAPKRRRKDGPLRKSKVRLLCWSALSMESGMRPTFWLCLRAQACGAR